jgi:hypothetical protein
VISIFGKRIDGVHGRRAAMREPIVLAAAILTLERSYCATVVDVSATGARLRSCGQVAIGQDLWVKVGIIDTLATVAWEEDGLCGVTFDEPLDAEDLDHLRHEAKNTLVTWLTPEEKIAAVAWLYGTR